MTAVTTMTRAEAAATAGQARAERDRIQANLLELDQSLGQRILAGADRLTGVTAARWETARAGLARLWLTFLAYSEVVDRAAGLLAGHRRSSGPELAELAGLLTGPSVRAARSPAPLAERDLTEAADAELTLAAAVSQMRQAYTEAAGVLAAAEAVWASLTGPLEQTGQALARARADLGDSGPNDWSGDPLAGQVAAAEAERAALQEVLSADPLSLWTGGAVDTARPERLREQVAYLTARAGEVAALRAGADGRIAAATGAVAAARAASQDVRRARDRAAAAIASADLPADLAPAHDRLAAADLLAALDARLAALPALRAAGRWGQLGAELGAVTQQAADAVQLFSMVERSVAALIGRRDELRGLLGAYRAKAAALGTAGDPELTGRYRRARDLLWTAPCQLAEADDEVRGYQQAVLALGRVEDRS